MEEAAISSSLDYRPKKKQRSSSLEYSRWAWLHVDILDLILEKLISISDYIRCGVVCKHWQSVANLHKKKQQQRLKSCHKQLPLLMIPTTSRRKDENLYALHNVTQGKTYNYKLQHLPNLQHTTNYEKSFCGCSHGWLAYTTDHKNLTMTLLNPFTGRSIRLPPVIDNGSFRLPPVIDNGSFYTSSSRVASKVVLSADPCLFPNDYEALAIIVDFSLGLKAAHFRSGNRVWTHIDIVGFNPDVIFYQKIRKFLLVNCGTGDVVSVNVNSDPAAIFCNKIHLGKLVPELPRPNGIIKDVSTYFIVESSGGDLLLIRKTFSTPISFEVFKLWSDTLFYFWVENASIGSDALFLGDHENMSVSALDFPADCRPNSIYFIDRASQNVVVFNLENGKQETPSYSLRNEKQKWRDACSDRKKSCGRSPIWILPTIV